MMNKKIQLLALACSFSMTACGQLDETSTIKVTAAKAVTCGVTASCDAAAPALGRKEGFLSSKPKGSTYHFGKDYYFNDSEDQWVIAKFQYGNYFLRSPLVHEAVEVQLLRDCGSSWEILGKAITTAKGEHATVLDQDDSGGMVYFKIPEGQKLGLGRHRIRLVVKGDNSSTDLFIEVLPANSTLFVSDVDGTLTTGELSEGIASIFDVMPPVNVGAPDLFRGLSKKGYHPLYLTARASNLVQRTREFVGSNKFPAGIISTSSAGTLGLSGDKGVAYKSKVLQDLEARGFKIAYAFGNTDVDARTFASTSIPELNRYFFQFDGFNQYSGGNEFQSYTDLEDVKNAADLCQ